jgi:hypothetical protein
MVSNGMTPNEWFERTKALMREQADVCQKQAKQWAVANHAPPDGRERAKEGEHVEGWENVKGIAEDNLQGYLVDEKDKIGFGVGQGVWYGKYLETICDGKHGICQRAVEHVMPEFDAQFKNALKRMPS